MTSKLRSHICFPFPPTVLIFTDVLFFFLSHVQTPWAILCGRTMLRDTHLRFHIFYFPCVYVKISFSILLHPISNGQGIPYPHPQGRTMLDSLWLSWTLFQKGQRGRGCWVAEWFVIFLAQKSSGMVRLGGRDHRQPHRLRVPKARAWVPERPW